jgi:hypothetical protein
MREKKIDSKTMHALEELKEIPARDPGVAARARANFLKEAALLDPAVSREATTSRGGWFNQLFPVHHLRSPRPVFNVLMAVFLALAVFLGASAGTVAAAQASLPDQALYPLKTWSEDVTVTLAGSPQAKLQYSMQFSDRRIAEMESLLSSRKPIPEKVVRRLQAELEVMLEMASGMGDNDMRPQLEQMRMRAEDQLQKLDFLAAGAPGTNSPALLQAQAQVREQVRWCALGLADPQGFRQQLRLRLRNRLGAGGQAETTASTPQGSAGNQSPGGNGFGPGAGNGSQGPGKFFPTATPTPASPTTADSQSTTTPGGSGPGPGGSQPTGTPGGSGPGPGGYQPTVTPGDGGPGPDGSQPTSTPGQNGPGPQSRQSTQQPGGL